MLLLIDNYDSFTYNLAQAFQSLGQDPMVARNDAPGLLELADRADLEKVCISPGPGRPRDAGLCREFLERLERREKPVPVLGVCLGHQVLGEFAGAEVKVAKRVTHGKTSPIAHSGEGLFRGLPQGVLVGRYHSLLVSDPPDNLKRPFRVTARTPEGEIMALSYKNLPWDGVQFHPESVLTPQGRDLLANFILGSAGESLAPPPETPFPLPSIFENIGLGENLSEEMAYQIFERLMDGELSPAQAGALLLSLRVKGETAVEVAAAASAILKRAAKIPRVEGPVLDVVGTGGDNRFSFNCSTATALTLASLGHKVLKHGNRSVSSRSGSADVLERLGFDIEVPADKIPQELAKSNFVFLFAPHYHPSFKHIMPIRRELGVRTLFNILGPLVNPAEPTHRLIGVYHEDLLDLMAGALSELGGTISAVAHGAGGYDELTPIGPAQVRLVRGKSVEKMVLDPLDFGFAPTTPEELAIKDPGEGARVLTEILNGKGSQAMRDMLAFNVGLALYLLSGGDVKERMREAKGHVESGAGAKLLAFASPVGEA
ncbi:MAG: anthranilate phosphoribosyltransferase [Deltaproteobacteria bacterium]|jgi:anthranilate synthase/phosphoribosyltransferase|nr:anthranilate phosphoribosyltransferase [Deltaproteobacteria bacterium]